MAILPRKTYKKIEWYLYHYRELKKEIEERKQDVILAADYSYSAGAVQSSGTGDRTGNAVLKMEELKKQEAWCEVVERTISKYEGSELGQVLCLVYLQKRRPGEICDKLHIDRSTFYKWRKEIITYAAMRAYGKNLISV